MSLEQKKPPYIVGIILSRLDSSRLPGKALKMLEGKPLISYCIERALKIQGLQEIVLATTDRGVDDPLTEYAENKGIHVFRGESNNVAKRSLDCAKAYGAEYFLRINGDSPFLDPLLVEDGLQVLRYRRPDIVTNLVGRSYPYGVAVELVSVKTLEKIMPRLDVIQAEHVTKVFYDRPADFNLESMVRARGDYSQCRMVVDDVDDLNMIEKVIKKLGDRVLEAGYEEVAKIYLDLKVLEQK